MFAMSIAFLEIFFKSFACLEAVRKKLVKGDGLSKGRRFLTTTYSNKIKICTIKKHIEHFKPCITNKK